MPYLIYRIVERYLQNQGKTFLTLIVATLMALLNVVLNYLFIYTFGWGFAGSPLATSASRTLWPIALCVGIYWRGLHLQTWKGWTREAYSLPRLKSFLRLGIPSSLLSVIEVLGYEVLTILAGLLGSKNIAAHSIGLSVTTLAFTVPLGLGRGVATRVGQHLGDGSPERAKLSSLIAVVVAGVLTLGTAAFIWFGRFPLSVTFTSEVEVIDIATVLLGYAALSVVFDGQQQVIGGILMGLGRPKLLAIATFISYYLVCFPLASLLAFKTSMGVYGLWIGLIGAMASLIVLTVTLGLCRIDWEAASHEARKRSEMDDKEDDIELLTKGSPFTPVDLEAQSP